MQKPLKLQGSIGKSEIKNKVSELIETVGLNPEHVNRYPYQLSVGQNLFISHDLEVVRYMSDRIAVMYLGKIVESGNTNDIFGYERHLYTKVLISPVDRNMKNASDYHCLPGCVFYPRCPFAAEICSKKEPEMIELEKGHWVACHFG